MSENHFLANPKTVAVSFALVGLVRLVAYLQNILGYRMSLQVPVLFLSSRLHVDNPCVFSSGGQASHSNLGQRNLFRRPVSSPRQALMKAPFTSSMPALLTSYPI